MDRPIPALMFGHRAAILVAVLYVAASVASTHVNINADAWGNCTGSSTLSWF